VVHYEEMGRLLCRSLLAAAQPDAPAKFFSSRKLDLPKPTTRRR
jgi:hypothetical protein